MTNCPNCGAPLNPKSPACLYCGTVNKEYDNSDDCEIVRNIYGQIIEPLDMRNAFFINQTQNAHFTAEETDQMARLCQNAFPYQPAPVRIRHEKEPLISPNTPWLFWYSLIVTAAVVVGFPALFLLYAIETVIEKISISCFFVFCLYFGVWGIRTGYKGL